MTDQSTTETYSAKSAAVRAARKVLGEDATPGLDFIASQLETGRWAWKHPAGKVAGINSTAPADTGDFDAGDIAAVHQGAANHFVLNEAGQKAVAEARAKKPRTPQVAPLAGMAPLGIAPPEAAPGAAMARMSGKFKEALEVAKKGILPAQPDFTAETHRRWRPKLAEVVALAEAGDVEALKAYEIKPISTSPKAIDRFRNLAVIALEHRVG